MLINKFFILGGALFFLLTQEQSMAQEGDINECFAEHNSEEHCWHQLLSDTAPERQYDFGVHYINGDGVSQDFTKGRYWVHQAALKNYPLAQYNLGVLFFDGIGGIQSQECALHWLQKAAIDTGNTGMMAKQALSMIPELSTQADLTPKVYRQLTLQECEQLPDTPWPQPAQNKLYSPIEEEKAEFPSLLAEYEVAAVVAHTFQTGLDALFNSSLALNNGSQKQDGLSTTPKEASLPENSFRQLMGKYFLQWGYQLMGTEANDFLAQLTDDEPKKIASKAKDKRLLPDAVLLPEERDTSDKAPVAFLEHQDSTAVVGKGEAHTVADVPEDTIRSDAFVASEESNSLENTVLLERRESSGKEQGTSDASHEAISLIPPPSIPKSLPIDVNGTSKMEEVSINKAPTQASRPPFSLNLGGELRYAAKHHYTIQLGSASQNGPLLALAKKQKLSNYLIYETQRYGRQWFVLVYGEYAGVTQAKQALKQLPASLKKDSPWIRSLGHVQSEL